MASATFLLAMLQTLIVPVLPQIGAQLHASTSAVGWVSTSTVLVASAVTPLLGRLGDVHGQRPPIIAALLVTLAGSVLAVASRSIELLILARALQGFSLGLFPLAMSVLRHEMPRHRLTGAMAITASCLGAGSGAGLVAAGVLTQNGGDYRRIFWLCLVLTAGVLALVLLSVPRRAGRKESVDYAGAALLALGLVCLLLPVSQGQKWSWASGLTIGLFLGAAVALSAFVALQARRSHPLVAIRLLVHRPVLATNLASLGVGFSLLSFSLAATFFLQTPHDLAGYGFTASVLSTSLVYMAPGSVVSMLLGPVSAHLVARLGARTVLCLAGLAGCAGALSLTVAHDTTAEMIAGLVVCNGAIGVAYAAMPALLAENVAPEETGVANSINSIMRTVGGAVGSAVVTTLLSVLVAEHTTPDGPVILPTEGAYQIAFGLSGALFFAAAVLAVLGVPRTPRSPRTAGTGQGTVQ
ncbi:MFS transporter [Streptomyces sp. Li-HN-5-11]|uniref:MFS transporter n=1 Tax=Streptomyces sp. Li-HN-5-11 TaxID=3075432 RepID=UPI0028A9BECD|nr:MFS transporter [Streptomyces sp. Li-HN-5-11]WNM34768.1 MFS transporter [Streptomyces sp. Li-HN-5-11]